MPAAGTCSARSRVRAPPRALLQRPSRDVDVPQPLCFGSSGLLAAISLSRRSPLKGGEHPGPCPRSLGEAGAAQGMAGGQGDEMWSLETSSSSSIPPCGQPLCHLPIPFLSCSSFPIFPGFEPPGWVFRKEGAGSSSRKPLCSSAVPLFRWPKPAAGSPPALPALGAAQTSTRGVLGSKPCYERKGNAAKSLLLI